VKEVQYVKFCTSVRFSQCAVSREEKEKEEENVEEAEDQTRALTAPR